MARFKFPFSKKKSKDVGFPKDISSISYPKEEDSIKGFTTKSPSKKIKANPSLGKTQEQQRFEKLSEGKSLAEREEILHASGIGVDVFRSNIIHPSMGILTENQAGLLREIQRETDFRPVKMSDYSEDDQKDVVTLSRLGFIRIKGDELQPSFIRKPEDTLRDE